MAKTSIAGRPKQSWLKKLVKLAGEPSLHYYELAMALAKHAPDAVSVSEVSRLTGQSLRRLYYLRDVGDLIRQHRISREQAERLGWTKLSILAQKAKANFDNASNITDLIDLAEIVTAHALSRDSGESGAEEADKALLFRLSPAQHSIVAEALQKCGATSRGKRGLIGKEAALVELAKRVL